MATGFFLLHSASKLTFISEFSLNVRELPVSILFALNHFIKQNCYLNFSWPDVDDFFGPAKGKMATEGFFFFFLPELLQFNPPVLMTQPPTS